MSARFIVILVGVALVVPFFFLPRGIGGTVLLVLGGIALVASLAEVGRQLFNDARWMIARMTQRRSRQPFNKS
jgi:VIT1/CCC1 family predicted Fe2+/Mn2+ transporter